MYKTFLHSNQISYEGLIDEQEISPPLWELVAYGGEKTSALYVLHDQLCARPCASQGTFIIKNNPNNRTSELAQWLKIHLPMQGMQV